MAMKPKLPYWLATPLAFVAIHAILVLGSALLMMTPFNALAAFLHGIVLVADRPFLEMFSDGEPTMGRLLVFGSLQWALIGLLLAIVDRWVGLSTKRAP